MAETKTKPTAVSPAAFISEIEDEQARQDSTVLVDIMEQITGEPPIMWGACHYRVWAISLQI